MKLRYNVSLKRWFHCSMLSFHRTVFGAPPPHEISVNPAETSTANQTRRKPKERRKRRCRKSTAAFWDLPVLLTPIVSTLVKSRPMAHPSEMYCQGIMGKIGNRNCVIFYGDNNFFNLWESGGSLTLLAFNALYWVCHNEVIGAQRSSSQSPIQQPDTDHWSQFFTENIVLAYHTWQPVSILFYFVF